MSESITANRLCDALGVQIDGLDLTKPLSEGHKSELIRLFDENYILVFKNLDISAEDQVRLLSIFGSISDETGDGSGWSLVSNVQEGGRLGDIYLPFHRDWDFAPYQPPLISLYGLELQGVSIPTEYVNCVKLVKDMPAELRSKLEGRRLVNGDYFDAGMAQPFGQPRTRIDQENRMYTVVPVLRPHPRTGELVIAASEMNSSHFEDMDAESSDALLNELLEYMYRPEHVYVHNWTSGDLVIWDNVAMMHGRRHTKGFQDDARRTLRRVAVSEKSVEELFAGTEHYRPPAYG